MLSHFRALFLLALLFATSSAFAQANCYAYRTKGGDAWQIACYPNAAACNTTRADYVKKTPSIEALGCAAQVYCFTYNAGGKSSACYMSGNECVSARNSMAAKSKDVGACVANSKPGHPIVQAAQVTPPPPPPPVNHAQDNVKTCFAFRISSGVAVNCRTSRDSCEQDARAQNTHDGTKGSVILGCTRGPLYCYSYNNGTSGACFADGNECVNNRNAFANKQKGVTVGVCKPYDSGAVRG